MASVEISLPPRKFQRRLSGNELSYFLPSRADGVNDMYLHLGFRATPSLLTSERLSLVWAIMRVRHPLLASSVIMTDGDYDDIRFTYAPPASPAAAIDDASANLELRGVQSKDELLDSYLNGPRTLSSSRLSRLLITAEPSETQEEATEAEFNIMFCATHYIGDGMALHQTANDFFTLLTGKDDLGGMLDREWNERWEAGAEKEVDGMTVQPIPASSESRLPQPKSKFQAAAAKIDFKNSQGRLIGGHAFPKAATKRPRKTAVPTISFDGAKTKAILKKCKSQGVTISNALFVLCNLAWIRTAAATASPRSDLPMMMYSAVNLRPYLSPSPSSSYWFLSVGYFNVILPAFLPLTGASAEKVFWHRSRDAKAQSARYMKSPMLLSRTQEMAVERGARAKVWARQDDEADMKLTAIVADAPPAQMLSNPPTSPSPAAVDTGVTIIRDGDEKVEEKDVKERRRMSLSFRPHPPGPKLFKTMRTALVKLLKSKSQKNGTTTATALPTPPETPELTYSPTSDDLSSTVATPVSVPSTPVCAPTTTIATATAAAAPPAAKTPSTALIGLSLLGNLDGTYAHAKYGAGGVTMHTLTTGSRQRSGGMLMFGYTFAGKMWVSLGWDVNAFEEGVVERFWDEVGKGVEEFVLA